MFFDFYRNDSAGVAECHVARKAETEGVEERKNNDLGFFARLVDLVNVCGLVGNFVNVFVGEHDGFAFSCCTSAVEVYGDVSGIIRHSRNSRFAIFFKRGGIAFAVFELREDCFKNAFAKSCGCLFKRSGVIGISAKQNGNAEVVEGLDVIL